MATLADFAPLVAPHAEGCPASTIEQAIRRALREFCSETHIWRTTLDPINTQASEASVSLSPPAQTHLVTVTEITHIDTPVHPVDHERLLETHPLWRSWRPARRARFFLHELNTQTLTLIPAPLTGDTPGLIDVRAVLTPLPTATLVEDFLLNDWDEAISYGALARLQRFPNKPWSELKLAGVHRTLFDQAISVARVRARRALTRVMIDGLPFSLPGAP